MCVLSQRADICCSVLPGSLAGYTAGLYTAGCCTCHAALAKTAMCFALLYAAVHSACAAAPDSFARYVALITAAACAAALNGIALCLACYTLLCPVPAVKRQASYL